MIKDFNAALPLAPVGKKNLEWQRALSDVSSNYQDLNPRLTALESNIDTFLELFCASVLECYGE